MPASQIERPRDVDLVLHRHHRGRDRLARPEVLKPALIGGKTSLVNLELLLLRLAEAIGALDMCEVAAELRVHLADDEVALFHRPRRSARGTDADRDIDRSSTGTTSAPRRRSPHGLHHGAIDLALLHAGPGDVAACRQHEIAELRRLAKRAELFVALDGADLLQHVVEATISRSASAPSAACKRRAAPSHRGRAARHRPSMPILPLLELQLLDAGSRRNRPRSWCAGGCRSPSSARPPSHRGTSASG